MRIKISNCGFYIMQLGGFHMTKYSSRFYLFLGIVEGDLKSFSE
jgi:hypothetical protein